MALSEIRVDCAREAVIEQDRGLERQRKSDRWEVLLGMRGSRS